MMTGPAPLLAVVLLAFLVGAAIPVLYQLYQILRRARALLDTAGPRLERALDQVGQAADRLNGIGSTLEAQAQTLRPLFEAASKLGHMIDRSGEWVGTAMTVGGAVGPAVIAGVRAFFSGTDDRLKTGGHPVHRSNKENGPDDQQPRLTPLAQVTPHDR
jgi:hypothetical protein